MITVLDNKALVYHRQGEVMRIDAYGPGVLRVRSSPGPDVLDQNWTLLDPKPAQVKIIEEAPDYTIVNGNISCTINRRGMLKFTDAAGNVILEEWQNERDDVGRRLRAVPGGDLYHFETEFLPHDGEHLYGMGMEGHDVLDLKGSVIDLWEVNTKITVPFVVSSLGYGFLWNNPGVGRAEFGYSRTRWVADACHQMDYLVFAEGSFHENVRKLSEISGYAPKFPEWATGLWQSKLRYCSQDELMEVAREYHRRNIPVSMMVCDFFHWSEQGEWKFDPVNWPDPAAMVRELKEMGMELMVSIWPTVDTRSENFIHMRDNNMLMRTARGSEFLLWFSHGPQGYMDVMNPETRDFVWQKVDQNYCSAGISHFWMDESEPECLPFEFDNWRYHLGNGMEVTSLYPHYYNKLFYDGLKKKGKTDIVNLIRSAFIGSQRLGSVLWSGDIPSTFDSLRKQIKAGLNVSLCGIPWWTTDIGGFHGGDPDSDSYREVMVRWFQFGAFCPVLRMHGNRYNPDRIRVPRYGMGGECDTGGPNELWSFGEDAYRIMKKYLFIRENLRPYIQEQFDRNSKDGTLFVRPMFADYSDTECFSIFDQYMFGPDIMACPICEAGVTSRKVYLPKGVNWKNAYTGELYTGGSWIETDSPLDIIPLFLREDSTLSPELFQAK